ncbi:MAG: hypothetical protein AB1324_00775 [Candidatus Micrarchaeota archaeon]
MGEGFWKKQVQKKRNGGTASQGAEAPKPAQDFESAAPQSEGPTRLDNAARAETREVSPQELGYGAAKAHVKAARRAGEQPDLDDVIAGTPDVQYSQLGRLLEPSDSSGEVASSPPPAQPEPSEEAGDGVTNSLFFDTGAAPPSRRDVSGEPVLLGDSSLVEIEDDGMPKVPEPASQPAGGELALMRELDPSDFVDYARGEVGRMSKLAFLASKDPHVSSIKQVAKERGLVDSIFGAPLPGPAPPSQAPPPTVREGRPPPPPRRSDSPKPQAQIVGDEPTELASSSQKLSMRSSEVAAALAQPAGISEAPPAQKPPQPPSRRPPPPGMSEAKALCNELIHSDLPTRERRDKYRAEYERLRDKVLKKYGEDGLERLMESAVDKLQRKNMGETVSLSADEQFAVDLNEFLDELKRFDGLVQQEQEFVEAPEKGAARRSRGPGGRRASAGPDGRRPSSNPPPAQNAAPVSAQKKDDSKLAKPPVQEAAREEAAEPQKRPNWFVRHFGFSNPATWAAISIPGFIGGAAAYMHFARGTNVFREAAAGIGNIYQYFMHRPAPAISPYVIAGAFSATLLAVFLVTERMRHKAVRAEAQKLEERDRMMGKAEKEKEVYVIAKLKDILRQKKRWQAQMDEIGRAVHSDPMFYEYLIDLRRTSWFEATMRGELDMNPDLISKFWTAVRVAGNEVMTMKFSSLAAVAKKEDGINLGVLEEHFGKMYEKDPVFHKRCDELFEANFDGRLLHNDDLMEVFAKVKVYDHEGGKEVYIGPQLREPIRQIYDDYTKKKSKK